MSWPAFRRFPPLALAGAGALLVIACARKAPPGPPPPPVNTAVVETADVPLFVETFGNCSTVASVTIVPQVTGILSQTQFKEGAFVKAGDPLFAIDPRPYQAALRQAQGDIDTAQADLVNAQEQLDRAKKLFATKVVDIQDLQNAQAAVTAAEGSVVADQAAIETARINLGYCAIASPIQGKTGRYLVNTGNLVTANTTQLVNIQTITPIYVDYTISEAEMSKIRQYLDKDGLDVEVTIPDSTTPMAVGKLEFIDNSINSQTGTLELRATFPNDDQSLWPGLFVNVRLILSTLHDATVVPATALLVGQNGPYVFVLESNNTVNLRPVTRGERDGDRVVIEAGLKPGEKVVTSGQIALAPGAKVSPAATPAAAASPAP